MSVEIINKLFAILTIIGLAVFLASFVVPQARTVLSKHGILVAFVVALGGTFTSLYYSNIVGYAPCVLCWYQRIFLYPQVMILGLALWRRDIGFKIYSLALAVIGAFVAVYHILVEHNISPSPCSATGVACSVRYVYEYGFISIPVMSLTAFLLIIAAVFWYRKDPR